MRSRALAFAGLLAAASIPFTVAAAGDEACEGDNVVTADGLSTEVDAPDAPLSTGDAVAYTLDLSGTEFVTGAVTATITWTVPVNDYDVFVNDEGPLETSLAAGGATSETAPGPSLGHCDTFLVQVDNFAAVDAADTVTLTIDVRGRAPR